MYVGILVSPNGSVHEPVVGVDRVAVADELIERVWSRYSWIAEDHEKPSPGSLFGFREASGMHIVQKETVLDEYVLRVLEADEVEHQLPSIVQ